MLQEMSYTDNEDGTTTVNGLSILGKVVERTLPVPAWRIMKWIGEDTLIQNAFPDLSADDREFLITGIADDEWDEITQDHDEQ